jgi:hypothetical protein
MAEIEAQPIRGDQGTLLAHMIPQDLPQGGMDKMGRGVVLNGRAPAIAINPCENALSIPKLSPLHADPMNDQSRKRAFGVQDLRKDAIAPDEAGIPDLSPRLRIEGCRIKDDLPLLPRVDSLDRRSVR